MKAIDHGSGRLSSVRVVGFSRDTLYWFTVASSRSPRASITADGSLAMVSTLHHSSDDLPEWAQGTQQLFPVSSMQFRGLKRKAESLPQNTTDVDDAKISIMDPSQELLVKSKRWSRATFELAVMVRTCWCFPSNPQWYAYVVCILAHAHMHDICPVFKVLHQSLWVFTLNIFIPQCKVQATPSTFQDAQSSTNAPDKTEICSAVLPCPRCSDIFPVQLERGPLFYRLTCYALLEGLVLPTLTMFIKNASKMINSISYLHM